MAAAESRTVLVVDDEPVILQLVTRILERAGFGVLGACDAEEALRRGAEPDPPVDAVVLDLSVFQDGLRAALSRLSAAVGPVGMVVVSGTPLAGAERDLLERHHHRYLSKPFAPRDLIEAVQSVIQV